jgi:hypothetical protein
LDKYEGCEVNHPVLRVSISHASLPDVQELIYSAISKWSKEGHIISLQLQLINSNHKCIIKLAKRLNPYVHNILSYDLTSIELLPKNSFLQKQQWDGLFLMVI